MSFSNRSFQYICFGSKFPIFSSNFRLNHKKTICLTMMPEFGREASGTLLSQEGNFTSSNNVLFPLFREKDPGPPWLKIPDSVLWYFILIIRRPTVHCAESGVSFLVVHRVSRSNRCGKHITKISPDI